MTKEIIIKEENYSLSNPKEIIGMAKIVKQHVTEQKLYSLIQGRAYVNVEGWQFAGGLLGISPRITEVKDLSKDNEVKWMATCEIIKAGEVISRGFAICSTDEKKKTGFDEYAVLSMAQTRAIGKAYRNIIGWLLKTAGYEATPAEEMVGTETVEINIDNQKAFDDLYRKLSLLVSPKKEELVKKALEVPPFELTEEMKVKLNDLLKPPAANEKPKSEENPETRQKKPVSRE